MKFTNLLRHLESCPDVCGAARRSWNGETKVVFTRGGYLAFVVGELRLMYALTFDDLTADDWEPS